jgi:prophage regulatory protein
MPLTVAPSRSQFKLFRKSELRSLLMLFHSTIHSLVNRGFFPRPIRVGERAVAWREADVREWLQTHKQPNLRHTYGQTSTTRICLARNVPKRDSIMRKRLKAKRSCTREVMVRAEFRYKRTQKEPVVRIVRRETGFLAAVAVLGRVISVVGVIKKLLGL